MSPVRKNPLITGTGRTDGRCLRAPWRAEDCGLRCVYHGWKYDVTGAVTNMPAEPAQSRRKDKVRITWRRPTPAPRPRQVECPSLRALAGCGIRAPGVAAEGPTGYEKT